MRLVLLFDILNLILNTEIFDSSILCRAMEQLNKIDIQSLPKCPVAVSNPHTFAFTS